MAEIEEVYFKITQTKTDKPWSKTFPGYLKKLMTVEQAELILAMPGSTEELVAKTKMPEEEARQLLQDLFDRGLVVGAGENLAEPEKVGWVFPKNSGFLHDLIGSADLKYIDDDLRILAMQHEAELHDRRKNAYDNAAKRDKILNAPSIMRVIPKWQTIKDIPGVLPIEDVREIFRLAPQLVIINCPCKALVKDFDANEEVPLESCIVGLGVAKHQLKRGTGREISYKEAIEISDALDHKRLVTMVSNNDSLPYGTCNCHPDSCMAFETSKSDKRQMGLDHTQTAKSRFVVVLNPEKCEGCRDCAEKRCPVEAIAMGEYEEYGEERAAVDQEMCLGCGLCVLTCQSEALKMKLVRPPEHIPDAGELSYALSQS
ncbi:MAG: 4Fe-4S dicluster domain-containing protein [Proteobacteria bacterium]|nr:4Fe-4S dicluster domain-containing protein [Pseudomonadota bacterium]